MKSEEEIRREQSSRDKIYNRSKFSIRRVSNGYICYLGEGSGIVKIFPTISDAIFEMKSFFEEE